MNTIYTWHDLRVGHEEEKFAIRWIWDDWDHSAKERQHMMEAATLWRMVFPAAVINPIFEALKAEKLEDCHAHLQRLASYWTPEFQRVLALPRVLRTRAFTKGNPQNSTSVLIFVTKEGVAYICRTLEMGLRSLRTFYFVKSLVKGIALFPQIFERNAIEHLADMYSQCNQKRLPSRNHKKHFFVRKNEIDRQITFTEATNWGFESDIPGATWIGLSYEQLGDRKIGRVDPPPKKNRRNDFDE